MVSLNTDDADDGGCKKSCNKAIQLIANTIQATARIHVVPCHAISRHVILCQVLSLVLKNRT